MLGLAALVLIVGAWWSDWNTRDAGVALLALTVFTLTAISRWYIVALQDRIIQLEMQVRCARVLPAGQDELLAQLSPKQIVALRFASDDGARRAAGAGRPRADDARCDQARPSSSGGPTTCAPERAAAPPIDAQVHATRSRRAR